MPYIKQEERKELDPIIDNLSEKFTHVGQLNYIITRLCHNWILKFGKRYVNLNAVMGVLSCVADEFSHVIVAPYEDEKIAENGGITALDTPNIENKEPVDNGLRAMPEEFLGKFFNACTDACDMLVGPCACGAWHHQEEWPDTLQMEIFGAVSEKPTVCKRIMQ